MFHPDQTAELSTPAGRKPRRADVASAADSIPDGLSHHASPKKIGVWEVGAIINDRYTLERRLGSGSMGEVFLASDRLLKKHVALKVLLGDMAKRRGTVRRFLREVALAHSVTHPNVVRIYDTGEADGLPYFSMEYLQGQTLEELIEASRANEEQDADFSDPPMTLREIREISYEILSGLAAAHEAGIVHRDLKPANVMLTHRGAIVMDFGVAGFDAPAQSVVPNPSEARSLVRTEAGTIFGSPAYMAPELWEGAPATVQSDLYSFGVMLYQMLSGRLPIEAPNAKAFLIKLREEKPTPIRSLRKDTPWNLALLVSRCMDRDIEQRPPTADAAANLVAPLAGRWRWILAAVGLALALGVAAFMFSRADEREHESLGLPDTLAQKDLDAFVRSFDVGDYDAASRQLGRLEQRAPDSAALVFWRATLNHDLGNEPARLLDCAAAGYEAQTEGKQWQGNTTWRALAMGGCSISYTMSSELWALLNSRKSSKLPAAWLPLAVSESLVPRVEAARKLGPSLSNEARDVLERLEQPPDFNEGPALAIRWELARLELYLALGRFDEARNLLDDLLTSHPEAPILSAAAAHFFAVSGDLSRARDLADSIQSYDPRPHLRLLLDDGRLQAGLALIDGYVLQPGESPLHQQMLDSWCTYALRFEMSEYPERCAAMAPGLTRNIWMASRENIADLRAMNPLERQIASQQAAYNRGECSLREVNGSIITHTLPPLETYLRQLDIYTALCSANGQAGPASDLARDLARELAAAAPGDPWAQLVDAFVDEVHNSSQSALEKRLAVLERWRDADEDLPLVRNVRKLVGQLSEDEPAAEPPAREIDPDAPDSGDASELVLPQPDPASAEPPETP